jgi:hypothetical protein
VITLIEISTRKKILVLLAAVFLVAALIPPTLTVKAQQVSNQQVGVHEYLNSPKLGNYSYLDGPFFPVFFNTSEIQIGKNWTIICPLLANHSYHVYLFGAWINTTSEAKTDYNVYVFDPQGKLESTHTEAAGFPEHLGTTVNDPYFVPQQSGNYTFLITNEIKSSKSSQAASFMIIENVQTDMWYSQFMEGKTSTGKNSLHTLWACEFTSNSPKIEVWIKVPQTLDMYESRLYTMNVLSAGNTSSVQNSNSSNLQSLNGVPLAWEPGLYGNTSGTLGGYNFESESFRGAAYASCEFMGQDMYMTYSRNSTGVTLYHLAFIGQTGSGNIQYLIKTQFNNSALIPISIPLRPETTTATTITYSLNSTQLDKATLNYTCDSWNHSLAVDMEIRNNTCSALIPAQKAGSLVQYKILATDDLKNDLESAGNFTVKNKPILNITEADQNVELGKNITVSGFIKFAAPSTSIDVQFMSVNETVAVMCTPSSDGTFNASFCPKTKGDWIIQAYTNETATDYGSTAMITSYVYQTFYSQNSFAIGGIAIAAVAVTMALIAVKSRNR